MTSFFFSKCLKIAILKAQISRGGGMGGMLPDPTRHWLMATAFPCASQILLPPPPKYTVNPIDRTLHACTRARMTCKPQVRGWHRITVTYICIKKRTCRNRYPVSIKRIMSKKNLVAESDVGMAQCIKMHWLTKYINKKCHAHSDMHSITCMTTSFNNYNLYTVISSCGKPVSTKFTAT